MEQPVIIHEIVVTVRQCDRLSLSFPGSQQLDVSQIHILLELLRRGGETSFAEMDQAIYLHHSSMVHQRRRLEEMGLMESSVIPGFRKLKRAKLTPAGTQCARQAADILTRLERHCTRSMSSQERNEMQYLLSRFYENLEKRYPDVGASGILQDGPAAWPMILQRLVLCERQVRLIIKNITADLPLETPQKFILLELQNLGGSASYKLVEKRIFNSQNGAATQMRKMTLAGLVESASDEQRRNSKIATLTPEGRECAQKLRDVFLQVQAVGCTDFSPDAKKRLENYLARFLTDLEDPSLSMALSRRY